MLYAAGAVVVPYIESSNESADEAVKRTRSSRGAVLIVRSVDAEMFVATAVPSRQYY